MPDLIRLLPDSIANQIAAGEVIQRPASVVKELVENAIDAGATRIRLDLLDAGRELIRISDNGCGMSVTDAHMAFERHATSKIAQVDDLFSLRTMGFRGEALASIAAVAQVELSTRTKSHEIGTRLIISGSIVETEEPVTCAVGSTFAVKNLFFNVPARRKFLKNNDTELRNILTEMERIVLVYPHISFEIYHAGKLLQQMPIAPLKARILDALGKRLERDLVPVELDSPVVHISGYIGKPDGARRRGAKQFFFVNGRYMRHPLFHRAILSAYEQILLPGVQPNYFIYLHLDPARIDVNIHPAKTEIKFADEQTIFKFIGSLCREGLASTHSVPTIDFDSRHIIDIPTYRGNATSTAKTPVDEADLNYNPFTTVIDPLLSIPPDLSNRSTPIKSGISWANLFKQFDAKRRSSTQDPPYQPKAYDTSSSPDLPLQGSGNNKQIASFLSQRPEVPQTDVELFADDTQMQADTAARICYIYKSRYIVTSLSSGLALVDFHRADMRIIYDRFLADAAHGRIEQQQVLFAQEIYISPSDALAAVSILDQMSQYGFTFVEQNPTTYTITAAPAIIVDKAAEVVADVLSSTLEGEPSASHRIVEEIALILARRRALPYGKELSGENASKLLAKLFASSEPTFTPDGKLILSIIAEEDIDRRFNHTY